VKDIPGNKLANTLPLSLFNWFWNSLLEIIERVPGGWICRFLEEECLPIVFVLREVEEVLRRVIGSIIRFSWRIL